MTQSKAVTLLSLAKNEPLGPFHTPLLGLWGHQMQAVHTADQLCLCPLAVSAQPYRFCLV